MVIITSLPLNSGSVRDKAIGIPPLKVPHDIIEIVCGSNFFLKDMILIGINTLTHLPNKTRLMAKKPAAK